MSSGSSSEGKRMRQREVTRPVGEGCLQLDEHVLDRRLAPGLDHVLDGRARKLPHLPVRSPVHKRLQPREAAQQVRCQALQPTGCVKQREGGGGDL